MNYFKRNLSSHTAVNPSMYSNGKTMRVLNNKILHETIESPYLFERQPHMFCINQ